LRKAEAPGRPLSRHSHARDDPHGRPSNGLAGIGTAAISNFVFLAEVNCAIGAGRIGMPTSVKMRLIAG
jgi:hypothetical protein